MRAGVEAKVEAMGRLVASQGQHPPRSPFAHGLSEEGGLLEPKLFW